MRRGRRRGWMLVRMVVLLLIGAASGLLFLVMHGDLQEEEQGQQQTIGFSKGDNHDDDDDDNGKTGAITTTAEEVEKAEAAAGGVQEERKEEMVVEETKAVRWLTFEIFPGRLNNQLLTLDWALRAALAFNRTVLIQDPLREATWIGLNYLSEGFVLSSKDGKNGLWYLHADPKDLAAKEAIRHIFFHSDDVMPAMIEEDKIPQQCIYDPFIKNVVRFMLVANALKECQDRIHFQTSGGLIHPWKSDTREMGVDPLVFWRLLRPAPYLSQGAQAFIAKNRGSSRVVSVHTRAHNSYSDPAPKAFARCDRIAEKMRTAATGFLELLSEKCRTKSGNKISGEYTIEAALSLLGGLDPCQRNRSLEASIGKIYNERALKDMCHLTPRILQIAQTLGKRDETDKNKIILCTDKELPDVDELFYNAGAVSFQYSEDMFREDRYHLERENAKKLQHLIQKREEVLMDMLVMTYSDIFIGAPSSTLSFVVCMWRYAWRGFSEKENYFPQLDTMCSIAVLASCGATRTVQ